MAEQDKPTPAEMAADLLRDVRKHAAAPQPDRLAALEQVAKIAAIATLSYFEMRIMEHKTDMLILADALKALSPAPAPCPECGGSKRVVVVDYETGRNAGIPCPRCSAQPAPSDVVPVSRARIDELLTRIKAMRRKAVENPDAPQVTVDVNYIDALLGMVYALRQGGGG